MKIIYSGVNDLQVVRSTNKSLNKYCVVWNCQEVEGDEESGKSYSYCSIDYDHKPTIDEVKNDIEACGYEVEDWSEYEALLDEGGEV